MSDGNISSKSESAIGDLPLNRTAKLVKRLQAWPFGNQLVNLAIGQTIPFVSTGRLKILEMSKQQMVIEIENRKVIQNHIGQVHAAAMILLAETCSGLLIGMNVQDQCLPLVKSIEAKFVKRSTGKLTARASLSNEALSEFQKEKGEITIEVSMIDSANVVPLTVSCVWAWIPKIRKT